ncbi:hypothetical protein C0J52_10938 [Blattella germanica]|nr:hypothetical protein C0J52_10938 [Blattella germanica]
MWKRQEITVLCIACILISMVRTSGAGSLYPFASESRSIHSLDGIWNFRLADALDPQIGHREGWYKKQLKETGSVIPMPVPSSYNDITEDKAIRDHAGVVWYDRIFYVTPEWNNENLKVWLRFGSVNYAADVYVNGELVISHSGGHIPFEVEVTPALNEDGVHIALNYSFDFFHYAGIHRPVFLYTTPATYIDDITVTTDVIDSTGFIAYQISTAGNSQPGAVYVSILDKEENYIQQNVEGLEGQFQIPQANLWWPYLMDPNPGYLYTLEVVTENPKDVYRLSVGIRKIEWTNTSVTINGKPIYIRGVGKHEDSVFRGRGLDYPLIARDYNLLKWIGANTFRTSHYPYSEEIMDYADREGIMVIDECPAINVGQIGFNSELLNAHKVAMNRLYLRDKNRPSVIMWNIANEAITNTAEAAIHFSAVAEYVKSMDKTRPVSMVYYENPSTDTTAEAIDIIGFNRYNGWYFGRPETAEASVIAEAEGWNKRYNKPVIMTEYGADTLSGLHMSPDYVWSEEFQVMLISKHFKAFDILRKEGFFIGEMIWNFADFNTQQIFYRVAGNKKGIFTRDRQPKAAAHHMRKRYWALAQELDNATIPDDVNEYILERSCKFKEQKLMVICGVLILISIALPSDAGILYPFESESRSVRSLDGIWNFRLADSLDPKIGHREEWYKKQLKETGPVIPMPVPSSYNDITENKAIRDHAGVVWYDRNFYVPPEWNNTEDIKIWLRFGSVNYGADVYVNGELVMNHSGCHVPFQAEITSFLKFDARNLISVAVDNTLTNTTVPQGNLTEFKTENGVQKFLEYSFDFFHYSGIHRPVLLYTTPATYIDDITVLTDKIDDTGIISYNITIAGNSQPGTVYVSLLDKDENYIKQNVEGLEGKFQIPKANFWWPYLMDPNPGYLYTLEVVTENPKDVYRLQVGIRKLEWTNSSFTINGKPIYIRGFGKHEDANAQFLDVIAFNRYNGWYYGHLETISISVKEEAEIWHKKYNKPVMMTEYGAESLAAFDELRKEQFFIGEMIWNFADFNTKQVSFRVGGNKKGIFTRDREPKAAAHHMRKRYWALAHELDNVTIPDDIREYVSEGSCRQMNQALEHISTIVQSDTSSPSSVSSEQLPSNSSSSYSSSSSPPPSSSPSASHSISHLLVFQYGLWCSVYLIIKGMFTSPDS